MNNLICQIEEFEKDVDQTILNSNATPECKKLVEDLWHRFMETIGQALKELK